MGSLRKFILSVSFVLILRLGLLLFGENLLDLVGVTEEDQDQQNRRKDQEGEGVSKPLET